MTGDMILALTGVFVAVALVVGLLAWTLLSRLSPARRRLQEVAVAGPSGVLIPDMTLMDQPKGISAKLATLVPKSPRESGRDRRTTGQQPHRAHPHRRFG